MLTPPICGWTNIIIGDWNDRASYLTSVHFDLLDKVADFIETRYPTCVRFDAEGWEYIIIFDYFMTYVIMQDGEDRLVPIEIKIEDIAKSLLKDIKDFFEDWVKWEPDCDKSNIDEYREKLQNKVDRLEKLIKKEFK